MLVGRAARSAGATTSSRVVELEPGDLVYVPPRETHVLENLSDAEPAEYVVARDAPHEDSVEVPWAEDPRRPAPDGAQAAPSVNAQPVT